jgi:hypothetical protein
MPRLSDIRLQSSDTERLLYRAYGVSCGGQTPADVSPRGLGSSTELYFELIRGVQNSG